MASRSLGPFPKTLRWREIVERYSTVPDSADDLLHEMIARYQALASDEAALRSVTLLVGLAVCSREADVNAALRETYGIVLDEPSLDSLVSAASAWVREDGVVLRALVRVLESVLLTSEGGLFGGDPWKVWRGFDGVAFCDLARGFYRELNAEIFAAAVHTDRDPILERFATETSLITRSFSARWFNACARQETPELGSIRWYLGHCLGKLELELERELSDWVEPAGNPWRRKRKNYNLKLAIE